MPTTDELRDTLAELLGWKWDDSPNAGMGCWDNASTGESDGTDHPIPDTIDGLAKLWPEGWTWNKGYEALSIRFKPERWIAFPSHAGIPIPCCEIVVPDTGNEYHDRLTLLIAVTKAIAESKKGTAK